MAWAWPYFHKTDNIGIFIYIILLSARRRHHTPQRNETKRYFETASNNTYTFLINYEWNYPVLVFFPHHKIVCVVYKKLRFIIKYYVNAHKKSLHNIFKTKLYSIWTKRKQLRLFAAFQIWIDQTKGAQYINSSARAL